MGKLAVLFLAFVLFPMVNAACIVPDENIKIREDTVFCSGIYSLKSGASILNKNLTLDCNNSVLTGEGIGYGILLKDEENIVVKNCNITNYEIGIYLDNSSSSVLKNNYLAKNKFGIALQNSIGNDIDDNNFFGNVQDKMISNITLQQEKNEGAIPSKKVIKNEESESYPPEAQAAKYHGNKGLGYYVIYLAVFLAVIVAFYSLYYRFYYERRKLK